MADFQLDTSGARPRYPIAARDCWGLYRSWKAMRERCTNPKHEKFPTYGGAGVTVCAEWRTFPPFKVWALANGWREGLTIERRENAGGYEPGNCTWATRRAQTLNRRTVAKNAEGVPFCDVARDNGIGAKTYTARLARGWKPERAATTPPGPALGRHRRRDDGRVYQREAAR